MVLLTDLVLVGSLEPMALLIQGATVSRHSHMLFRMGDGNVIDSTFEFGGVKIHKAVGHFGHYEHSLPLHRHYNFAQRIEMTKRAMACLGTKYDTKGILFGYLPNRPTSDWQRRLWCFEFGRVVMDGFLTFDHRPDRAVGRHWVEAIRNIDGERR